MTEYRYKAYISYSHKDEVWAAWLHRALESYRVPRKLVGARTSTGDVPNRIRPVFRDREDLSSATDLKETVKQTLAESENLIVVCSPNAAGSHWVGEEIRQFDSLGRADRIFCIIVGGEPEEDGSMSACFPAALANAGLREPLAADVRKWADGKHVAMLKLIAGLLGIRLDELRQRDLLRRRKRKAFIGVGVVTALTLAIITIFSQISERHEREKAEQLATFVVELGERLQSVVDLETRALISEQAAKHLENLNPENLSPETGKKVALAFRQIGLVNQGQGRLDEALEAFQRSRDLLSILVGRYPEINYLLFQLGNAEYYIGSLHHSLGRYDRALKAMEKYYRVALKLFEAEPGNPDWIMELSYSHNNLAAVRLDGGMDFDTETQVHVAEAVRLAEIVQNMKPDDKGVTDGYTTILAWAADAQNHSCNLENAMVLRTKVTVLRDNSLQADPGNNDLKKRYAYDLSGLSMIQIQLGLLDPAEQNLQLSVSLLRELSAADSSNVSYQEDILIRQYWLAKLAGETGRTVDARFMLGKLEKELRPDSESAAEGSSVLYAYINLLITLAEIEFRLGQTESANSYLQSAMQVLTDKSSQTGWDNFDTQRVLRARYQWWEQNGEDGLDRFSVSLAYAGQSGSQFQSCDEADIAARMYVLEENKGRAASQVEYLTDKGYAEPAFIRFCKKHELCS